MGFSVNGDKELACLFDIEASASTTICSELGLDGKGVLHGRKDPSGVCRKSPDF